MVVTARVPPGHLMPCHNVWDGEVCRCLTLIPVVMPPVQAAWVAPNQHLERRMMADGGRNSVLHPLSFLNTTQIWSKWSFCELRVSLPAVLCLFMVSVIQGNSGSASSLFLIVFWESHSGETCRCWFKQYQVYYFVPKDPLHILFRIFYLGLVALHEYFNSEFWFCSKLWEISGDVSSDLQNTLTAGTLICAEQHK